MCSEPDVSVVVPTHNRPAPLSRCLEALAQLSFWGAFEVVVVDDGGHRPAAPVITGFEDRLAVHGHRQGRAGPAAARNTGLRIARGRLVAFTDDDCAPEPGWLAGLVAGHRGARDLVGGRCVNLLVTSVLSETSERLAAVSEAATRFHTTNNLLADRDRLANLGGFDESFTGPAGEDRALSLRWRASGGELVRCPDAVVGHAHHLDLCSFLRQQERFGRAVPAVAAVARDLSIDEPRMGWPERRALVTQPWCQGDRRVAVATAAAQAAVAAGYLRQCFARRGSERRAVAGRARALGLFGSSSRE